VIHRALELGINLFDTAADYSDSEAILGRALRNTPGDQYFVATKFTPTMEGDQGGLIKSPEDVIRSCERSLTRLQIGEIDIFQFHGVLPENYRQCVDQLFPTVEKLLSQGKIRFVGVTEYFHKDPSHQMLEMALNEDIWDTMMVKYGILNQSARTVVFPRAQQQNVGLFNMSAVRSRLSRQDQLEGIIARWKSAGLIPHDALPEKHPLDFLIHHDVQSVVAAGYKFGIEPAAISSLLVGTGNVSHLEQNISTLLGSPLPEEDSARIHELFGCIAETEWDPR
jgi:aryl-alcohol dehydrogenase-like predicted oxidoreductase